MKKSVLLITCLFSVCTCLFAKDDTYIYDFWGELEKSPDAYKVTHVVYGSDLNLDKTLTNPTSLFCYENYVYVVDTGNNRILKLEYTKEKKLELVQIIDKFNSDGKVKETFSSPKDLFIGKDGSFFIADTGNGRVVKLDKDLNYILSLVEPDDPTYQKGKDFLPEKVIADDKGRAYVLAKNVNKGFIKYEYDGTFTGFYGANKVIYNFSDYIWKKFATKAQRDQMVSFVPTEFSNAYMDNEGFIFAVTKTFDEWDLLSDKAQPIRRLNSLGDDILVKNSYNLPIGDLQWGDAGGIKDPSKFTDVTVLENEVYIAIDETHGRIFAYNNQGYLLFAFSNRGNIDGFFRAPVAIDHIGKDLFVLDNFGCSITVFTPTEYGNNIYKATELFACGDYDGSAEVWQKVLDLNANYDLAYIGLGKAYLRKDEFKKAMDLFELKKDRKDYSKAFGYYRKEWIEANFGKVVLVLLLLVLIPIITKIIKKFKKEFESL